MYFVYLLNEFIPPVIKERTEKFEILDKKYYPYHVCTMQRLLKG